MRIEYCVLRIAYCVLRFTRPLLSAIALLLLILLFPTPLQAQSPDNLVEVMVVANQNYESGDYNAAIQKYEQLVYRFIRRSVRHRFFGWEHRGQHR